MNTNENESKELVYYNYMYDQLWICKKKHDNPFFKFQWLFLTINESDIAERRFVHPSDFKKVYLEYIGEL